MNNYALDSPINRKVYVPGENEVPFAPVTQPKPSGEIDQTHRKLNWLFHKPSKVAFFPNPPVSARIKKEK
jgi:hypothetical protein